MQISVESTGALERRMEVSVPKEQIEQAVDERLKRVSRTAKLKGFRPGKAPIKVIRQQFGAQVRQEVLSDLMQSSFAQAVTRAEARAGRRSAHRADQLRAGRRPEIPRDLRDLSGDRS